MATVERFLRRRRQLLFFFAGAFLAGVCWAGDLCWVDIVPYRTFAEQPDWLKLIHRILAILPWIALACLAAIRLVRGRNTTSSCTFSARSRHCS